MAEAKEEFGENSRLEDELSCPICFNLYRNPVCLSCGHNFCKECIQRSLSAQQHSNAPYSCPMCKLQLGPILELQRNFKLCSIVETFLATASEVKMNKTSPKEKKEVVPCDFCLDQHQPAVKTCLTCDSSLCQAHLSKHEAKASQKDHILVEPGAGRSAAEERMCREHGRLLECLCEEDGAYICMLCLVEGSHRGHDVITVREACNKSLGVLSHTVKGMQENKSAIAKALEKLQESEDELKVNTITVTYQLTRLFEEIKARINKKEEHILSIIQSNEKKQLSDINEVKKRMEQKRDAAEQHLQSLQKMREQPDALLFLKEFKLIKDRIKDKNFKPEQMEVLIVEMSPDQINRCKNLMGTFMHQLDLVMGELYRELENQLRQNSDISADDRSSKNPSETIQPPHFSLFFPLSKMHGANARQKMQYKTN